MSFLKSIGSSFTGSGGNFYTGVGSALNKLTGQESAQNKTYKQQLEAMDKQNAYNTYMWNLQNEYNSPASQLARMREAGIDINPTSYALGTGNLSNTAVHVGSESGFAGSGSPAGNPISMLMGMAQGIQGVRESQARQESIGIDNEIKQHDLDYAEEHDLPVHSAPGLEASIVSHVSPWVKKRANQIQSWLEKKGTHHVSYYEKNKDRPVWDLVKEQWHDMWNKK